MSQLEPASIADEYSPWFPERTTTTKTIHLEYIFRRDLNFLLVALTLSPPKSAVQ